MSRGFVAVDKGFVSLKFLKFSAKPVGFLFSNRSGIFNVTNPVGRTAKGRDV
jgi:hypothetical protein